MVDIIRLPQLFTLTDVHSFFDQHRFPHSITLTAVKPRKTKAPLSYPDLVQLHNSKVEISHLLTRISLPHKKKHQKIKTKKYHLQIAPFTGLLQGGSR